MHDLSTSECVTKHNNVEQSAYQNGPTEKHQANPLVINSGLTQLPSPRVKFSRHQNRVRAYLDKKYLVTSSYILIAGM